MTPHVPLRVSVVTETYPPEINGVANTVQQYVRGLGAAGHRVLLVRPSQGQADQPQRKGDCEEHLVTGVPLPMYRNLRFGLASRRELVRLWGRFRPQVTYISTEGPLGHAALLAARSLDIPVISGYHTQFDHYSRAYHLSVLQQPLTRYLRYFHNRCDATLVPTQALKESLQWRGFKRLHVHTRGVDTELFNPARRDPELRRRWGVEDGAFAILYVGRIANEKNIDLLFEAFAAVRARGFNARVILVGEGPAERRLRRQHPEAVFCGPQRGDALAAHYASADLFVFPSESETFGNVIPEAMASGLPIVGYDYAAAREWIGRSAHGVLAEFGDAEDFVSCVLEACERREQWTTWGLSARKAAEQHAWPAIHSDFIDILSAHATEGAYHDLVTAA